MYSFVFYTAATLIKHNFAFNKKHFATSCSIIVYYRFLFFSKNGNHCIPAQLIHHFRTSGKTLIPNILNPILIDIPFPLNDLCTRKFFKNCADGQCNKEKSRDNDSNCNFILFNGPRTKGINTA